MAELVQEVLDHSLARVLPGSTPADADLLARDLGRHVLALLVAADLIAAERTTVREFVAGLTRSVTELLDAVGDRPALTGLYRKVLDQLGPDGRAALELLIYLDTAIVPTALVVFALPGYRGQPDTSLVHARARARGALLDLRNHHLIAVTDDQITVPNLVRSLVIGLTHDDGHRIAGHARAGVLAFAAQLRADRPDTPPLRFAQDCAPLISHVRTTLLDPWKTSDDIAEHVYHYARAFGMFMETIGAEPWRFVLLAWPTGESSYSLIVHYVTGAVDVNTTLDISIPIPDHKALHITAAGWGARRRMLVSSSSPIRLRTDPLRSASDAARSGDGCVVRPAPAVSRITFLLDRCLLCAGPCRKAPQPPLRLQGGVDPADVAVGVDGDRDAGLGSGDQVPVDDRVHPVAGGVGVGGAGFVVDP